MSGLIAQRDEWQHQPRFACKTSISQLLFKWIWMAFSAGPNSSVDYASV